MKKTLTLFVLLLVCTTKAHAQVGTAKWSLSTRSDVVSALKATRGNLRQTYEVMICAARQGFTSTSVSFYAPLVRGQEFRASGADSAAFAFADDLNGFTFRPWNWKHDPIETSGNLVWVGYFRDRALKLLPNSPEVLVMRSFYEATTEQEKGYQTALKATRLAPRWADAYYWTVHAAIMYGNSFGADKSKRPIERKMGQLALQAAKKAEPLDLGLRPKLFLLRLQAYELLRNKESVKMIPMLGEMHFRAFPSYATWARRRNNQSIQQVREEWARAVKRIEAELDEG